VALVVLLYEIRCLAKVLDFRIGAGNPQPLIIRARGRMFERKETYDVRDLGLN
jgi:hypothetical protein